MDWHSILLKIDREQLDPRLKPILDELVADTMLNAGNQERLLDWLLRIPPAECSPRNTRTIETVAMNRLAHLGGSQSVAARPRSLGQTDSPPLARRSDIS